MEDNDIPFDAEADALRDDPVSQGAVPLETDFGLACSGSDPYARV